MISVRVDVQVCSSILTTDFGFLQPSFQGTMMRTEA
jgi:hypothetical protein